MLVIKVRTHGWVRLRFNGADVWLQVAAVGQESARLAFEAPRAVEIHRDEVLPDREQYAAAGRDDRLAALAPFVPPTPAG